MPERTHPVLVYLRRVHASVLPSAVITNLTAETDSPFALITPQYPLLHSVSTWLPLSTPGYRSSTGDGLHLKALPVELPSALVTPTATRGTSCCVSEQLDSRKPLLACHPRPAHNGGGDGVVTPLCPAGENKASSSSAADWTISCDNGPRPEPKGSRPVLVRRLRGVPGELLAGLQRWRKLSRKPVCLHAAYQLPRLPTANRTEHGTGAAWLRKPYERGCKRSTLLCRRPKVRTVLHATHWIRRRLPRAGLQVLRP
uniref:Uncharacterized protein n=1 Tax=Rhipicephalus zambeziensis TaxID=60191 RepID=A0A224YFH7_9ACAR